jgi:hypothetical protein
MEVGEQATAAVPWLPASGHRLAGRVARRKPFCTKPLRLFQRSHRPVGHRVSGTNPVRRSDFSLPCRDHQDSEEYASSLTKLAPDPAGDTSTSCWYLQRPLARRKSSSDAAVAARVSH